MRIKLPVCLLIFLSICLNLFAPLTRAQKTVNPPQSISNGLNFRISEAARQAEKPEPKRPPIAIENLSESETAAIFNRLPPLPAPETEDNTAFKTRPETIKPPKTGGIIPVKFPSNETRKPAKAPEASPAAQNLQIARYSPVGAIPLAVDLSVTFSQPMTAVTSQAQASEDVPIELKPEVKGRWRWLGTDTLIFDADGRFPMATVYTATVPKGTRSAGGAVLAKDFSWTFTTPPPKIERFLPQAENREIFPDLAIMAAKFDQEIDEKDILSRIRVTANGKPLEIKSATSEVTPNYVVYQSLGEVKPKHWLAFRTVQRLPLDANVQVVFEKGLPSAEGGLKSAEAQTFSFRTLAALKHVKSFCGSYENKPACEPADDFVIRFNHSLYPANLDSSQIRIEPEIENVKITAQGDRIYIQGRKKPKTTYKVTVAGALMDFYKQPLGTELTTYFNVDVEQTQFFTTGGDFLTLDPNTKPVFSVYSKNHASFNLRLYAVTPADYLDYREVLRDYYNKNRQTAPNVNFGRQILNKTVEVKSETDVLTETRIDLSEALPDGFGHAVLVAEPTVKKAPVNYYDYSDTPFVAWIQATNIGIDAQLDYEKMTAYVSELKTGKPLPAAEISLHNDKYSTLNSSTNAEGLAELTLGDNGGRGFLLVKSGVDSAILREEYDYAGHQTSWRKQIPSEHLRWFVFDDRKMYRPGEEVSVKGYLRRVTGGKYTDIAELGDRAKNVTYVLRDARNIEIARGEAPLNAFGAFDLKLSLPENANLGAQRLQFWAQGKSTENSREFEHIFRIEEFRRPEFEVRVETETPAPHYVGNSVVLSAEAKYLTGGAFVDSLVNWSFTVAPTFYSPPGNEGFIFGKFVPWWRKSGDYERHNYYGYPTQSFAGTTDKSGKHRVNLDFISANPARPYNLRVGAETSDVNRQSIGDTKNFLVHPSEVYVGLRTAKTFVRQGETLTIEAVATDIDGKRVRGATVEIVAVLKDWQRAANYWQDAVIDTQTCRLTSSENVSSCNFNVKQGGRFTITATVHDAKERPNTSETLVWAAGGNTAPKRGVEKQEVDLIPGKKDYAPGETAEILVNAPFFPAEGVMTLERSGVVRTERVTLKESSTVLRIPIEESFLPNVHVKLDLVGATERTNEAGEIDKTLPKRPAFASGEIDLKVSTRSRKLSVTAEPIDKITAPGQETKINVEVRDNLGNPVGEGEVAVVAVDEGVLSLTDYRISNPLDAFYQPLASGVTHYYSRDKVVLADPNSIISAQSIESLPVQSRFLSKLQLDGALSDSDKPRNVKAEVKQVYKDWMKEDVNYIITEQEKAAFNNGKPAINLRRNFDALAVYSPSVKTDAAGRATVAVKLPDNLTRYRITAVAVTKSKQFGLGESSLTARQDLMVRPSAPRFMNYGDKAELPVVLQNESDQPLTVSVALRGTNARLLNGGGKRLTIPANERAELRFPVAVEHAGTARFQVGAVSGALADAAEIIFPVYTPATTETFATYGTTDQPDAIVQNIQPPGEVLPQFGGLELTTSSTQLQELTDAFLYVYGYSYGCNEQTASRVLSIAALRDVLLAFKSKEMPTAKQIAEQMRVDIERLEKLQHADGGFSFWRADDAGVPYVSVHIAHALGRARQKGYPVRADVISKATYYLQNIESRLPETYSEESRRAISAYALFVRDLLGDKDASKAKKLIADAGFEKLSPEALGWLLMVVSDDKASSETAAEIKRQLLNRVTETAAGAHFVTSYRDGEYVLLASERRADAVILEALLKTDPQNVLIPKIVRGLLAAKTKGRWQNTQENTFAALALDKYFNIYEKVTPDFVTRVWLGNTFAGEQKFAGRSIDSNQISVPMSVLQQSGGGKQNLTIDRRGEGRLYYRIGMKYAPRNFNVAPADYGFEVTRAYEAVDNPADVRQNSDNSWTIRSGARVRVRIKMVAPVRRHHVALVDNLPAGFEIINSNLATAGVGNVNDTPEMRRRSYWFEHQNLRDNRAEAFTQLLGEGVWNYSYLARATTPGTFIVPPAKAEEMYTPETFGRSRTNYVKVE